MTALPTELQFGYVVFRAVLAVADTSDPGREPDAQGAQGTVTFTAKQLVVKTYSPSPVTVGKQEIVCTLDASGTMIDPMGAAGVYLITGQYVVTYKLTGITLPSHDIQVDSTHTSSAPLDLTTAIPPDSGTISLSSYEELNSRVLVLEAQPPVTASPAGSPPANPEINQIWVKY